jgi:uncharacterized protein
LIKLDVASLPEGSSHVDLTAEASELDVSLEGGRLTSPIQVSLDVTRNENEILLRGRASVTAVLECARCLEEYSFPVQSGLEVWCILGSGKGDHDPERDNVIEVPDSAKYIDLTDHLRSELVVVIPLKPLCKQSCKGLCPLCGVNLNHEHCSCHSESRDARWDALKKITGDQ